MKYKLPIILSAICLTAFATVIWANPTLFYSAAQSATATSTLKYMTPGTATTTVVYDTWAQLGTNQTSDGNRYIPDSVTLKEYLKASSTATVLVTNVEYSDDNIDWYQNNLDTYAAGAIAIAAPNTYTWTFATSTIGGVLNGDGTDVGAKVISLKVPTRFIRVVLSLTGANGGVWVQLLPKKQISQSY